MISTEYSLDLVRRKLTYKGRSVRLAPLELKVFLQLYATPDGERTPFWALYDAVYGPNVVGSEGVVYVAVHRLRRAIEPLDLRIDNAPGVGYVLGDG